jgi:HTH-type transcriptional regulator, sugar sensing transcriptional regulator
LDQAHGIRLKALQKLGFNESEGRVYLALLQHEPLTGYEIAKVSGVPRANVYSVLQKLEQRGAVVRLDRADGVRYAPVPSDELLQRLRQRYEHALAQTGEALAALAPAAESPPIVQFEGRDNLIETAQQLIRSASEHLMLAIWPEEAQALTAALASAEQRAIEITTLCLAGCRDECGSCRGAICRYPFGLEESERWLLLIADEAELCAGSVQPSASTAAIRTRQPFLVRLTAWYIRHSITVATLITDLNLHLDEAMSPRAREALNQLFPSDSNLGWLEQMRQLLRERRSPSG